MAVLALVSAIPAWAQPDPATPFAGWTLESADEFQGITLEQLAGDLSPFLREYGFYNAQRRVYIREGKTATLTMYEFRDTSSAYGAFTFLAAPEMKSLGLADPTAVSPTRAIALKGDLVILLDVENAPSWTEELKVLLRNAATIADATPFPTLPGYLPAAERVPLSERYVLGRLALSLYLPPQKGDWLGFEAGAEVCLAQYRAGRHRMTLILAAFPTPQGALGRLKTLEATYAVNPEKPVKDGRTVLHARRMGSLLAIIPDAPSPAVANALLGRINYKTEITWNEPTFKASEIPFSQMLVGIFIGTLWILLYTLLCGIIFGVFRVLITRILPEKVFDRPQSTEIIRLNLGAKPNDSNKLGPSRWS